MSSWTVDATALVSNMGEKLGRPLLPLRAVLRIMESNLEPALVALNFDERAYPKGYYFAGEDLGDPSRRDSWPKLLIGGAFSTQEFGTGHTDQVTIQVTCAYPLQVTRREFAEALDVVAVARGILRYPEYSGKFPDPDDPTVVYWNHLYPTGFALVPPRWADYMGWIAQFVAVQVPGSNLWAAPLSQD